VTAAVACSCFESYGLVRLGNPSVLSTVATKIPHPEKMYKALQHVRLPPPPGMGRRHKQQKTRKPASLFRSSVDQKKMNPLQTPLSESISFPCSPQRKETKKKPTNKYLCPSIFDL
jgi:hypothetical protein